MGSRISGAVAANRAARLTSEELCVLIFPHRLPSGSQGREERDRGGKRAADHGRRDANPGRKARFEAGSRGLPQQHRGQWPPSRPVPVFPLRVRNHGRFAQASPPVPHARRHRAGERVLGSRGEPRMARLGIEPRTPRFSATRKRSRDRRECPANRQVVTHAMRACIPRDPCACRRLKDVARTPRPFRPHPAPTRMHALER
jgi:hypothetical protein